MASKEQEKDGPGIGDLWFTARNLHPFAGDVQFPCRRITLILGPNGSGKTTLMRAIARAQAKEGFYERSNANVAALFGFWGEEVLNQSEALRLNDDNEPLELGLGPSRSGMLSQYRGPSSKQGGGQWGSNSLQIRTRKGGSSPVVTWRVADSIADEEFGPLESSTWIAEPLSPGSEQWQRQESLHHAVALHLLPVLAEGLQIGPRQEWSGWCRATIEDVAKRQGLGPVMHQTAMSGSKLDWQWENIKAETGLDFGNNRRFAQAYMRDAHLGPMRLALLDYYVRWSHAVVDSGSVLTQVEQRKFIEFLGGCHPVYRELGSTNEGRRISVPDHAHVWRSWHTGMRSRHDRVLSTHFHLFEYHLENVISEILYGGNANPGQNRTRSQQWADDCMALWGISGSESDAAEVGVSQSAEDSAETLRGKLEQSIVAACRAALGIMDAREALPEDLRGIDRHKHAGQRRPEAYMAIREAIARHSVDPLRRLGLWRDQDGVSGHNLNSAAWIGPRRMVDFVRSNVHVVDPRGSGSLRISCASDWSALAECAFEHRHRILPGLNAKLGRLFDGAQLDFVEQEYGVVSMVVRQEGRVSTIDRLGSGVAQALPFSFFLAACEHHSIINWRTLPYEGYEGLRLAEVGTGQNLVFIEHPELHLHPAIHATVASLFSGYASHEDVRVQGPYDPCDRLLIETHSEHLLLQLLADVRSKKIHSSDLSVVVTFVDDEGRSRVRFMDVDCRGRILGRWPGGFFPERYTEMQGGQE